jgi:hypothetical protein
MDRSEDPSPFTIRARLSYISRSIFEESGRLIMIKAKVFGDMEFLYCKDINESLDYEFGSKQQEGYRHLFTISTFSAFSSS